MTIANGSVIDGAELYAALNARVSSLQFDDPGQGVNYHLNLDFESFGSGTPLAFRQQRFTMPDDMQVVSSRVSLEPGPSGDFTVNFTGPLTHPLGLAITGAGTGLVSTSVGTDLVPQNLGGSQKTLYIVLLKGATYTATVTSSVSGLRTMRIPLEFNSPWRR
jgi:hypothetical protein